MLKNDFILKYISICICNLCGLVFFRYHKFKKLRSVHPIRFCFTEEFCELPKVFFERFFSLFPAENCAFASIELRLPIDAYFQVFANYE